MPGSPAEHGRALRPARAASRRPIAGDTARRHRLGRILRGILGETARGLAIGLVVVGASPAALRAASTALDTGAIDRIFADVADPARRSPGCALGVSRDGLLIYERGYGLASLEQGVPIGQGTVFELASVSKQFMAASLVLLEEDGRLALEDDVRKWIPELPQIGSARITLRQMLHHTSGLRDYVDLLQLAGWRTEDWTTTAQALEILARQRGTNFAPGTRWEYNDSNYFLLSLVVERATGKTWREFAAARLFAPLGMRHTEVLDDHTRVVPGRATPYQVGARGTFTIDASNWEQAGDGGVQTTVEDLALWNANLDRPRVGGERLVREMESRGRLDDGEMSDYGLGLKIDEYRGARRVGHSGSWVGWRTAVARFPEQRLGISVLCNVGSADAGARLDRVADVILAGALRGEGAALDPLGAFLGWPSGEAPPRPEPQRVDGAERYAGEFYSPELDATWRIENRGGALVLRQRAYRDPALAVLATDLFEAGPLRLQFDPATGERVAFSVALGGLHGLRFERIARR